MMVIVMMEVVVVMTTQMMDTTRLSRWEASFEGWNGRDVCSQDCTQGRIQDDAGEMYG